MEKAGYDKDGLFRSLRTPLLLPKKDDENIVSFLFRDSSAYAEKSALVDADSGESLCFGSFKYKVYQLGSGLHQRGIRQQDVVLLFAPNSIYFPLCFFGILSIGAVVTTVNPLYTTTEVSKQVQDSKTKLIITVPALWDKVKNSGLPVVIIGSSYGLTMPKSGISVTSFSEVLTMGLQKTPPTVRFKQTDIAALLYSSGTTGTSKGAVLSHRNFISCALMMCGDQEASGEGHMSWLVVLPLFHAYGMVNVMTAQLQRGNTLVLMGRYEFVWMLKVIQEYKITHLPIVPPIMIALANHMEIMAKYDLSSLKEIFTGAAPLGTDIMKKCATNIPNAIILQGYGLTETCGLATLMPRERKDLFGSSGTLVSGVEAKIASLETGKPLPPTERGEIWLRGPNIMAGYFNNPNATKETIDRDGWLHTGDLGFFDENGNLYVVDRIKELIKCKGFQVAPAELEGLLLTHPEIVDAAVIGRPHPQAGEVPVAFIVLSSGSSLNKEDVMEFISKQVAPFKRLHTVIFTKTIPKSASGKILRRELVQIFNSKL